MYFYVKFKVFVIEWIWGKWERKRGRDDRKIFVFGNLVEIYVIIQGKEQSEE